MSDDSNRLDRRKVLKTTAVGLTSGGTFTATATAAQSRSKSEERSHEEDERNYRNSNGNDQCNDCGNIEIISEDNTHVITEVERDNKTYVYRVEKERTSVEYIGAEDDNTMTGGVSPTNHNEIIERSTFDVDNEGSCSSWAYGTDYSVVFAFRTGDSLDDYPSGILEGAICAAIGSFAGGPPGAAFGAIACFSVGFFFLSHIDLSGRSLSIGVWDCHQGWLNEPSVCTGATASYTTNHRNLVQGERIPGPHLSMGNDIESYL